MKKFSGDVFNFLGLQQIEFVYVGMTTHVYELKNLENILKME